MYGETLDFPTKIVRLTGIDKGRTRERQQKNKTLLSKKVEGKNKQTKKTLKNILGSYSELLNAINNTIKYTNQCRPVRVLNKRLLSLQKLQTYIPRCV